MNDIKKVEGVCPYHETTTSTLDRHSGYWKSGMIFLGIFMTAIISFAQWQASQTTAIRELVASLDKNISMYTAIDQERLAAYEKRLEITERDVMILYKKVNGLLEKRAQDGNVGP